MAAPSIAREIAAAFRTLRRRPTFAAAALATLALGIGAPTTIFSVVRAVLLRQLPYADADRIVRFRMETLTARGQVGVDALPVAIALDWAAASETLASVAVYSETARTITTGAGPVRLGGLSATPNLFALLGTRPLAGRIFDPAEADVRQVVFSHTSWIRYFEGSPSTIGSLVSMDGVPHRVVGIMPAGFDFPSPDTAFWVPVILTSSGSRGLMLPVIGRVKPEATTAAVAQEGQRHLAGMEGRRDRTSLVVRSLQDQMVGGVRRTLWVLMAAVGVVSVIATVNISLLFLTEGAARANEFSVRLALGASRGTLVRQVSVEGLTVAVLGGTAGLLFVSLLLPVLVRMAPPEVPRLYDAGLDLHVLAFSGSLIVIASIVFSVLSAGRVVSGDAVRALAGGGAESRLLTAGVPRRHLNFLGAAELALAAVLLVGAGLLIRSFVALVLVDQGFDPRGSVAAQVTLPSARYPSPGARMDFHERLLQMLRRQQGVAAAGVITAMPNRQPTGRFGYDAVSAHDPSDPFAVMKLAEVRMASEGFFEAMGLAVVAGRGLTPADVEGAEPVIVLSEEMARIHFPGGDAVGRMLYSGSGDVRVAGIVRTVRPAARGALQYDPSAYLPLRQDLGVFRQFATMSIVVRGSGRDALMAAIRSSVRSIDPELAVFNVRALEDEVAGLVAGPRFSATLLALFAVVATAMAAVGIYGVVAYSTGRRTREIGIRMALGATREQIVRLILCDGLRVVAVGLSVGLLAAAWLARSLTALLHEVTPADPLALGSVAVLLSFIGVAAVYVPARRAMRMSALGALREQ